jgi:hypothetical protein
MRYRKERKEDKKERKRGRGKKNAVGGGRKKRRHNKRSTTHTACLCGHAVKIRGLAWLGPIGVAKASIIQVLVLALRAGILEGP